MELQSPARYIAEWGGKIGGHLFLKDSGGFDQFLPDADFLKSDQDFDAVRRSRRYSERNINFHK